MQTNSQQTESLVQWRTVLQSLTSVWSTLDSKRRLFVALATMAAFATVLFLARGAGDRDMALLFGGLEPQAAGEIITALDQRSVAYEIRGGSIFVASGSRDTLRMVLAGEGLPANGGQGYELLDSLSGFSTTSQMFDAAYWRAKEGELARTILASPRISAARVHIATPASRAFQRNPEMTASITVTTASGSLAAQHVKALQYLVGSAVNGLSPDAVAVIDGDGKLLSGPNDSLAAPMVNERSEILRQRAERLLVASLGHGNAVVEVTMDTVTETETITERSFDPDSRVAISTDVQETSGTSSDNRNGSVTVASNLPDGDANGSAGQSVNETSETRSLTNYEVSATERQLLRGAGAIKRLTVAVLVNDITAIDENGATTTTARSADELASLEELVASAIGIDRERGDVITVRSLPFEPLVPIGTEVLDPVATAPLNIMQLIQIGVLAVVSLVLGLFVVRPILAPGRQLPAPEQIMALPDAASDAPQMMLAVNDGQGAATYPMGADVAAPEDDSGDPVAKLRRMISDKQPETLQILQDWIEEKPAQEGA